MSVWCNFILNPIDFNSMDNNSKIYSIFFLEERKIYRSRTTQGTVNTENEISFPFWVSCPFKMLERRRRSSFQSLCQCSGTYFSAVYLQSRWNETCYAESKFMPNKIRHPVKELDYTSYWHASELLRQKVRSCWLRRCTGRPEAVTLYMKTSANWLLCRPGLSI